AAMEAAAAVETTAPAMEATAAVKATAATMATTATTASGICRDRQDHRASQHGSACGEFRPEFRHGCRHWQPLPRNQGALIGSQPQPVISIQQETNCSSCS